MSIWWDQLLQSFWRPALPISRCFCPMQVEQRYNKLLDSCSKHRDEMGEITDQISLGTALETLWSLQDRQRQADDKLRQSHTVKKEETVETTSTGIARSIHLVAIARSLARTLIQSAVKQSCAESSE